MKTKDLPLTYFNELVNSIVLLIKSMLEIKDEKTYPIIN
jgi:hypothetical protein